MSSTGGDSGSGGQGGWGGGSRGGRKKQKPDMSIEYILEIHDDINEAMRMIIENHGAKYGLSLTDCETKRDINEWIEFIQRFLSGHFSPHRYPYGEQLLHLEMLLLDLNEHRNKIASRGNSTRAEESESQDILKSAARALLNMGSSGESPLVRDQRTRKEATAKFHEVQARTLQQKPKTTKFPRARSAKIETTAQRIMGELKEEFYPHEIAAILERLGELNKYGNDSEGVSPPDEHSHGEFKRFRPDDSDPGGGCGGAAAFGGG